MSEHNGTQPDSDEPIICPHCEGRLVGEVQIMVVDDAREALVLDIKKALKLEDNKQESAVLEAISSHIDFQVSLERA